ncbi:MAG: LuxR C-terminal-related transcriptional regulator [Cyanobacteria bacterium P01_A01_bin.17]
MCILQQLQRLREKGSCLDHVFLKSFLDSFAEGLLVYSLKGELLHANHMAYEVIQGSEEVSGYIATLGKEVENLFELFVRQLNGENLNTTFLVSDVELSKTQAFQLRARYFQVAVVCPEPMIWISIEDQHKAQQAKAFVEAQKYGLSEREREVWQLRIAGYSYLEVAKLLFISINTVKRHLKNIHLKIERYRHRQFPFAVGE